MCMMSITTVSTFLRQPKNANKKPFIPHVIGPHTEMCRLSLKLKD